MKRKIFNSGVVLLDLGTYDISVALIAIMLSIAGIVLGMGFAIDDKKLKEFGRSEIYQCLINGIIVGSLIIAFSSNGIVTHLINNTVSTANLTATCDGSMSSNYAICFSYNYLVGLQPVQINGVSYPTLIDTSLGVLAPASILYTGLSILSSIKLDFGLISIGFSSALNPILTVLDYLIRALTASIIAIEVQGMLLKFISVVAIPVLLPIGIMLRTFYLTRRLGGAIMAIAIGLFTVLPLTYVMNAELASNYLGSINSGTISTFLLNESNLNSNIIGHATSLNGNLQNQTSSLTGYFTSSINGIVSAFDGFVNTISDFVALIIIEVFFLPVFSIILTVISIRELAKILGSEISFGKLYIF
jgi:hypothetical protein